MYFLFIIYFLSPTNFIKDQFIYDNNTFITPTLLHSFSDIIFCYLLLLSEIFLSPRRKRFLFPSLTFSCVAFFCIFPAYKYMKIKFLFFLCHKRNDIEKERKMIDIKINCQEKSSLFEEGICCINVCFNISIQYTLFYELKQNSIKHIIYLLSVDMWT